MERIPVLIDATNKLYPWDKEEVFFRINLYTQRVANKGHEGVENRLNE